MATSSIFTTVRVSDPKRIESFINALDEASNSSTKRVMEPTHSLVTDPEKLREMMAKRFPEK